MRPTEASEAPEPVIRVENASSREGMSGALIGAAAAGIVVGFVANLGRKAAVQAVTTQGKSWIDALHVEHQAALKIFDLLQATRDEQVGKRTTLLAQLKHALAKHAFQEENVIYAALRDEDRKEEADRLNHDHGYVKQFLYDLELMPKDHPRWLPMLIEFRGVISEHIRQEEQDVFPALRAALSQDENSRLTVMMNKEGFKLA